MSLVGKSVLFQYIPPNEEMMRGQVEYARDEGKKRPEPEPGDICLVAGALIGCIVGIIIGVKMGSLLLVILFVIAGGVIGTLLGSLLATLIKKYRSSRSNLRYY